MLKIVCIIPNFGEHICIQIYISSADPEDPTRIDESASENKTKEEKTL